MPDHRHALEHLAIARFQPAFDLGGVFDDLARLYAVDLEYGLIDRAVIDVERLRAACGRRWLRDVDCVVAIPDSDAFSILLLELVQQILDGGGELQDRRRIHQRRGHEAAKRCHVRQ